MIVTVIISVHPPTIASVAVRVRPQLIAVVQLRLRAPHPINADLRPMTAGLDASDLTGVARAVSGPSLGERADIARAALTRAVGTTLTPNAGFVLAQLFRVVAGTAFAPAAGAAARAGLARTGVMLTESLGGNHQSQRNGHQTQKLPFHKTSFAA
jgi:hypothetical protein